MESTITIFYCENNKYFISTTPSLNYIKEKLTDYELSTFVNVYCSPHIKQSYFVQNNKIIGIKKTKSILMDSKSMIQFSSATDFIDHTINNIVLKYMYKYGIDNVRGGSYINLKLTSFEYQIIVNKLKKLYKSHNMIKQAIKVKAEAEAELNKDIDIINCDWDDEITKSDSKSDTKSNTIEKFDLDLVLNDLNNMTFYVETLKLCLDIDPDHFTIEKLNNIIKANTSQNRLIFNHPIILKIISYSNVLNFSTKSNYVEIKERYRELRSDTQFNIITQYLNLKAELLYIKSELAKLNLKYDSVENLQKIIDEELNNPDRLD